MTKTLYYDSIIIGTGLAGLSSALRLADNKQRVALITKKNISECNSYYAQGGIAAVLDANDSMNNHINDTMVAGAGLCNEAAVKYIVHNSPEAINWLINQGVQFTPNEHHATGFHMTREG